MMCHVLYRAMLIVGCLEVNLLCSKSQSCPEHIHVEIQRQTSAKSATDKLQLTSILSGVSIERVEYYWWLIHEINSPIYTFSNIHNIDEINQEYGNMITDETHDSISNDSFRSTLEIVLSEIDYGAIRCEFVLNDYSICSRVIELQFPSTMGTFLTHRQHDAMTVATTIAESNENDRTIRMMRQDIEGDRRKSSGNSGKLKDQDRATVNSLTLYLVAILLIVALLWTIHRFFQRRKNESKLKLDSGDEAEVFVL